MTWSGRRKTLYISVVVIVILAIIIPIGYKLFPKPSCTDGIQNEGEQGVDCDGPCPKVCQDLTAAVQVLWTRQFKVSDGVYSAVAYVSNPNFSLYATNVPYTFKLYDDKNILIIERHGQATILPNTSMPLFEGLIQTGNRIPVRAFFAFDGAPVWQKIATQPKLEVKNSEIENASTSPRLQATLTNDTVLPIRNIQIVAVLYDINDNAIAASQTVLDVVAAGESEDVTFTWPHPFTAPVNRIEVYPKFITSSK